MKARTKISDAIENIDLEITVTMSLSDRRQVAKHMQDGNGYPNVKLFRFIQDAIGRVFKATDTLISGEKIE